MTSITLTSINESQLSEASVLPRSDPVILDREDTQGPPDGRQTFVKPDARSARNKLIAANWVILVAGMNDAATGALIPSIKSSYHVGLLFVAIVYLVNFCGWMLAAFTNAHVTARFGMGGTLIIGTCCQAIAYALNFWKPPFPVFACSFFFSGLGVAFQDAQANTFVANLDNAHRWLGILHAIYGVGALIAPLAATAIVNNSPYWHYFYLVLFGSTIISIATVAFVFGKELTHPPKNDGTPANKQLSQALSQRAVWILSMFFFLYVGAEVTAGGWVVEFLIEVRNGSPSEVGYVASGFWGGLALGRIVLADITNKFGERRMVLIYIVIGLVMQLLFWFVPNVIANAVVVSLLGFIIAPFFPAGISVLTRLLPRDLHVAAIGFTSTVGQAGSAAFPFLTGAIASKAGVKVLQPIMIGLLAGMFILWTLLPRVRKAAE